MCKLLKKYFKEDMFDPCTVRFYKCIGYIVLSVEIFSFLMGWELLLFELIPVYTSRLFIFDLLSTIISCALLMATIRSLYFANRIKSYATAQDVKAGYQELSESENKKSHPRFCKKCKIFKGTAFHHCSICNKCVYELDHHCFFLANCVGGKNYKFFLSYVLLSFLNCFFVFLGLIPYIVELFQLNFDAFIKVGIVKTVYCSIAGTLFGIFTIGLFVSHMYYMANNTSFLKDKFKQKDNEHTPKEFFLYVVSIGYLHPEIKSSIKNGYQAIFGDSWKNIFWPEVN